MKISKSRIKQIISESLNKILSEESSQETEPKKSQHGHSKLIATSGISDEDLINNYRVITSGNFTYLIHKAHKDISDLKKADNVRYPTGGLGNISAKDIKNAKADYGKK